MRTLLLNALKRSARDIRLCDGIKSFQFSSRVFSSGTELRNTFNKKVQAMTVFLGTPDRFGGLTIASKDEACDFGEFLPKLEESLKVWKEASKRAIWFKVDLQHSEWVPVLVKNGFVFHHAQQDFVMLHKWLPEEPLNIPAYAHTLIGVGALVVNDSSQVLVVKEKYSILKTPHWKLPGGYVEPGEDFVDAAIREVLEETNVQTEFVSLLTLNHSHRGQFGCSDIYIVVQLKPLTSEITKEDREIVDCQWMDLAEFQTHPQIHELNRLFVRKYLDYKESNLKINFTKGVHQLLQKPYTVYHVSKI